MLDETDFDFAMPSCPVCLGQMTLAETHPIMFPNGRGKRMTTFACKKCNVEANRVAPALTAPMPPAHLQNRLA